MKKRRVMIVDDEATIREGFKRLFDWEKHGCLLVGEACDGMDAIYQAQICRPDIVFMDINLPILSGLEAMRILKERYPNMAFIVVSGYDEFKFCQEALRLKAAEYLLKPVDFDEIGAAIERLNLQLVDEKAEREEEQSEGALLPRIVGYLKEHLSEEITLQKLSELFHLNPNYISKRFKEQTGVNYSAYLTKLRLDRAKALLMSTDRSINEIAEDVGFRDYRVFTKVFKEREGQSPSIYRKYVRESPGAEKP